MLVPKIQQPLRPYAPDPSPESGTPVSRYLDQELRKIGFTLNEVVESYSPNVIAELDEPQAPLAVDSTHQPITDWRGLIRSWQLDKLGLVVDPLAGTVALSGAGDQDVVLEFWCHLVLDVSAYPQNEELEIWLHDGVGRRVVAQGFKARESMEEMTFSATYLVHVPNDAVLQLEIWSSAASTVGYTAGDWGFRYVHGVTREAWPF